MTVSLGGKAIIGFARAVMVEGRKEERRRGREERKKGERERE